MGLAAFFRQFADVVLPLPEDVRTARAATEEDLKSRLRLFRHELEDDVYALFPFRDPLIRALIHALKYHRERRVAYVAAAAASRQLRDMLPKERFVFIPIPLHATRKKVRGYNQAELIATALASHFPQTAVRTDILLRIRDTESQTRMANRKDRVENMRNAFLVRNTADVCGKTIVVIDDVTTTGSTLGEARRILIEAGATRVISLALAH